MGLKLYTYPGNKNAFKALIAAEYVGASIDVPAFNMGVDNKKPEFLKLNPNGKASRPCYLCAHVFRQSAALCRDKTRCLCCVRAHSRFHLCCEYMAGCAPLRGCGSHCIHQAVRRCLSVPNCFVDHVWATALLCLQATVAA